MEDIHTGAGILSTCDGILSTTKFLAVYCNFIIVAFDRRNDEFFFLPFILAHKLQKVHSLLEQLLMVLSYLIYKL